MLTWSFFKNYLFSSRAGSLVRTIARLCIFAIGIGVFSLVIVVSVMNGFNKSIRTRLLAAEPELVVHPNGHLLQIKPYLQTNPSYEVHRFETQDVILRTLDGLFSGAEAKGLDEEALSHWLARVASASMTKKDTSASILPEVMHLEHGEVLLGVDLARSLGVFAGDQLVVIPPESLLLPPGETPTYEKVTVKKLITTDIPEIDSHLLLYPLGKSLKRFDDTASRQSGYEMYFKNPSDYSPMQTKLQQLGAKTESWVQRNSALFFALKMEKLVMTTFLSLATLITTFSIISVLVLLLNQKQKDIGVMMSLGLSKAKSRRIFTRMGIFLSGLGMGTGLLLGGTVAYLLEKYPVQILPNDIYYDSSIPAQFRWSLFIGVAIGCVVISFLAAWLPARFLTRMTPSEALRGRDVG